MMGSGKAFRSIASTVFICAVFAASPGVLAQAAKASPATIAAEMDALIKAAKAEGQVSFYTAPTENTAKRVADAFTAKYGIRVQFVRLAGNPLMQRYAAEAESGNFATDMIIPAGTSSITFAEAGIKKGWLEPVQELPVIKSGEFPARFIFGPMALAQIGVWNIGYNTEKLKPADVPKDFPALLDPKYKGQIMIGDPAAADSYVEFYSLMMDKYGESFLTRLKAQNPRYFTSTAPGAQSLAAGEASILIPALPNSTQAVKDKGAPVALVAPEVTTGAESYVMLTHRSKAKNPNAGRLLANYFLAPEGNKLFNADPGGVTVYDLSGLPKGYQSPTLSAIARKPLIQKLIGP